MNGVISFGQLKLNRQIAATNILLSKMFEINIDSFIKAVVTNNDHVVELFIQSGFDTNLTENNGNSGLSIASYYGFNSIVQILTPLADKQNPKAILSAISNDQIETLKLLIQSGFDINIPTDRGVTALSIAVLKKSIPMVSLILQNKGNPNLRDEKGDTPLMLAIVSGLSEIVQILIEGGADINNVANDGFTPILLAAYSNNFTLLKYLALSGADVHCKTNAGHSLSDMARNSSNSQMLLFLKNIHKK